MHGVMQFKSANFISLIFDPGPTETPSGETVLLVGDRLGNAVLFSIGAAFRARGSRVLYFAGYKSLQDRYKVEEIEHAADTVVWCCDEAPGFASGRPQDRIFVEAIEAYGRGALGLVSIPLSAVDRIIAIGSDGIMAAVAEARQAGLKRYFRPDHRAIASINAPMQCMMKEICAQCLQRHHDPVTGTETVVFSSSTRTRRWTASISAPCAAACHKTASRKN